MEERKPFFGDKIPTLSNVECRYLGISRNKNCGGVQDMRDTTKQPKLASTKLSESKITREAKRLACF